MTRTFLLREGSPEPDGVGAVRRFAWGPGGSQEEVVAWEPPHHLGYVTLRGLPVRSYRADVRLIPDRTAGDGAPKDGGGTVVTWRSTFTPLVPGTGGLLRLVLERIVSGFATSVCRYADDLAARRA